VTSQEITEWKAFYELEPWGEGENWLRAGSQMSLMANIYRNPKVRSDPFTPFDFIPGRDQALVGAKENDMGLADWNTIERKFRAITGMDRKRRH